jgi:hypothetical protein
MATRVTPDTLARLADVDVPGTLTARVMADVVRERRLRPLRAVVAAASFAAWALLVHQAVQFATVRLQGLI